MPSPRPTEELRRDEVAERSQAEAPSLLPVNAEQMSHLQHEVEPMDLDRVESLTEDDLSAAVALAVHLGRATRAVQLSIGAALTYRKQRMHGQQWRAYLSERCTEWGRSDRTMQRWMLAAQEHYQIEAPKGAQRLQRGAVRTPVIPRGGGRPAGSTPKATNRPDSVGEMTLRRPAGGQENPEGVLVDEALASDDSPTPTQHRPLRALPPEQITPNEAAIRLIDADPSEMSLQSWRSVRHAAEEAIAALVGARAAARGQPDRGYGDATAGVTTAGACSHPKAERVVRNGGIVACGACGQIRRPSGVWV